MDDLAAKLKRRFDNWQAALNDSDQTVRQCQMKRAMFQADLEEAYRAGQLISLETHKALLAAANEAAAHIMPRYFVVYSRTGVHIGVWEDIFTASQVLAEYPGGRIIETVEVSAIAALTTADAQAALDAMISRAREEERAKSTGLPSAQRILDRNVLQYMEECRPGGYPRSGFAYHLNCFVAEPWVTKDMARATCRSLTDRGYAFYMRGLWSEDGEPLGAGYGITDAGAYYLASLLADQPAALRANATDASEGER